MTPQHYMSNMITWRHLMGFVGVVFAVHPWHTFQLLPSPNIPKHTQTYEPLGSMVCQPFAATLRRDADRLQAWGRWWLPVMGLGISWLFHDLDILDAACINESDSSSSQRRRHNLNSHDLTSSILLLSSHNFLYQVIQAHHIHELQSLKVQQLNGIGWIYFPSML